MGLLGILNRNAGSKKNPSPTVLPNGKKVLIVEDEKSLADALELKFKQKGFETARAGNGQEGLNMLISYKPDVIILDLIMPVMDGKSMLRALREMPAFSETPVIILTNAGDADNIRETKIYHNANEFLIKVNVDLDEVLAKVNSVLIL